MTPVANHNVRVSGFVLFTAENWRSYAQACRAMAVRDEQDAEKQSNPAVAKIFNDSAKHWRELVQKAELAAKVL